MCGMCGFFHTRRKNENSSTIHAMMEALKHRGPDGEGFYADQSVALGHRRLAVIDLSDQAKQPMSNENGSLWIVFNGMIYNYPELAEDLKKKGHVFKSKSDTEVILHLYEETGQDCVNYLRGMFAFALWDKNKEELFLARDRIGQKPLCYARTGDTFIFASEPKAILASGLISPEVNPAGLHYIFSYKSVPYPMTMFKNIYKLPPASCMIVKEGKESIRQYWRADINTKSAEHIRNRVEKLFSLLDDSVNIRLTSDAPIGAFLSGGVDSSLIASFISQKTSAKLKTFSVGMEEHSSDTEFHYARKVALRYNMDHHEIHVDNSVIDEIERVVWHYDEPYSIPEALVNMKFCREVKKSVTVALTGDGSDELFAGYSGYLFWKILGDTDNVFSQNNFLKKNILPLAGFLKSKIACTLLQVLLLPENQKRAYLKRVQAQKIAGLVYSQNLKEKVANADVGADLSAIYSAAHPEHLLDGTLYTDLMYNDSHAICTFSDISGMSNGLELRSPFLDHHIVEFAAALPAWMKIKGMNRKYILKLLAQPILPQEILKRKKYGYAETIPLRTWLTTHWKSRIEESIFHSSWDNEGYFDIRCIKNAWERHCAGKENNFDILWSIYCYSTWKNVFFNGLYKN